MVTTAGVRTRFDLDLDFPVLSQASEKRVIDRVQRRATAETRKRLVRPWKAKVPVRSGLLRRTLSARKPRKPREKGYFVGAQVRHQFYFHFLGRVYPSFRADLAALAAEILPRILAEELITERQTYG